MLDTSRAIIADAIRKHSPVACFALFSGGHDSLTATSVAMETGQADAVAHINTGIGIEDTREFVRETCRAQGWPLLELHPPGLTYEQMVLRYGFPGPAGHLYAYSWLKERALRQLVRAHKAQPGDRVMLITGVRRQESRRRMGHVEPVVRHGGTVWVAPLVDWSKLDCGRYLEARGLPRNPVVDKLHMSGECLCGSYARPGELEEIRFWYPETAAMIDNLERRAVACGRTRLWGGSSVEGRQGTFLPMCLKCDRV